MWKLLITDIQALMLLLLAISSYMTGVIWTVQLVVYPNFHRFQAESKSFRAAMEEHGIKISFVVMVPMLLELFLAVWITWLTEFNIWMLTHLLCVLSIWISTFFLQVPAHNYLRRQRSEEMIHRLVDTNWIRTILWTVKTIILGVYILIIL